jgi:hypothetical protein
MVRGHEPGRTEAHCDPDRQVNMQSRPILTTSLGLNLALVAALLYQVSALPKPDQFRKHGLSVTNQVTELDVEVVRTPQPEAPPPFKWADVESADYKIYIANLKNIGCPSATIRDIILAEVREQYAQKRTAMMAPYHPRFWELTAVSRGASLDAGLEKRLEALAEERETLTHQLAALIGPIEEPAPALKPDSSLSFLPADKQQAVAAVENKYRQLNQSLFEQIRQTPSEREEKMETIRNLRPQKDEEIRELLTPAELEEYRLRTSRNARWASTLYGFEPTLEEYRAVTRLLDDIKPVRAAPNPTPVELERTRAEAAAYRVALAEGAQKIFGEKRFSEYERANDPTFKTIYQVADRYQLPAEAATQAYQLRRTAEEQYKMVMREETLSDDQRVTAVLTVHAEAVKALSKTFGDAAYKTYMKAGGDWLSGMLEP